MLDKLGSQRGGLGTSTAQQMESWTMPELRLPKLQVGLLFSLSCASIRLSLTTPRPLVG
jgi:hypothetical protein